MKKERCPFCREDADVNVNIETLDLTYSNCLCGKFIIIRGVKDTPYEYNKILTTDEAKKLFSGYLRNNNQTVKITKEFIREELPGILDYCQGIPLNEKISKITRYIFEKTTSLGRSVQIDLKDLHTLFYLKNSSELVGLLDYLIKLDLLRNTRVDNLPTPNVTLTVEGFSKCESELKKHSQSKKVFIACKFGTNYQDELVSTIKAACRRCGFEANIVSDEKHNKDISHKIISDIKQSKFIIADFTDQNNGVYFEAGYAMGESKEVIRLIKEGQFKKLHFDTRQFSHIPWKKGKWDALEEELIDHINATINKNTQH